MGKFRDCKYGQRVESAVFNEMWNLSCFPNEHKQKKGSMDTVKNADDENQNHIEKEKEQSVVIGLRLCALPRDIGKLTVRYRIRCIEFEQRSENECVSSWVHTATFDYDNYYVKSPKHSIRCSVIDKYDELTFVAEIDIIEMFDLDEETIGDHATT